MTHFDIWLYARTRESINRWLCRLLVDAIARRNGEAAAKCWMWECTPMPVGFPYATQFVTGLWYFLLRKWGRRDWRRRGWRWQLAGPAAALIPPAGPECPFARTAE